MIAKGLSLKTVLPHVILITISHIFPLVGKDQFLIQPCISIPVQLISRYSQGNATLLMLDFHLLVHFLSLIEVYNTILLSGAMQIFGMSPIFITNFAYLSIFISPTTPQELFNLRHASAQNIVERIFGILKNRFAILQHNPSLTPKVQAHLPAALAALHNLICKYDPEEIDSCIGELDVLEYDLDELDPEFQEDDEGELAKGPPKRAEKRDVEKRRDEMANEIQYQQVLWDRDI
jgi:hypothetical protein